MSELFFKILNMSISASWLVLAVLLLRLVLKKASKWINVLLWGVVAVRLVCPFSLESAVSLVPDSIGNGELVAVWMDDYIGDIDIHHPDSVSYDAAIGAGREPISDGEGGYYIVTKHDQLVEPATVENTVMPILAIIWLIGMVLLALYTTVSYWCLHRRVATAVRYRDNIFQSDHVISPFVLGIIRPRIYLPFLLDEQVLEHVVAHEQAHIRRKDHWWKPLGFLLLTIHWFNPLMWLAYVLLCRDIELACDEKVIKELGSNQRADYTQALVSCSVSRRRIAVCPLAFGEVGVKKRVKSVMNYRKPAFWVVAVAVISCVVVAICFLTNPKEETSSEEVANEEVVKEEASNEEVVKEEASNEEVVKEEASNEEATWKDMLDGIELADLDGDGKAEQLSIKELTPNERYAIRIIREDDSVLWSTELGLPHTGWDAYFLYQDNGVNGILRYNPAIFQGLASYFYELYTFPNGEQTTYMSDKVEFNTNPDSEDPWPEEAEDFAEEVNALLSHSKLLISTLDGELHQYGDNDVVWSCVSPLSPDDIWAVSLGKLMGMDCRYVEEETQTAITEKNLFASMPGVFHFLSGAGGWQTELYWNGDGTFSGIHEDADVGAIYRCIFKGNLDAPQKIGNLEFSARVTNLNYDTSNAVTYENGNKIISVGPYGLDDVDEIRIYLPGYPVSELPDEVLEWLLGGAEEFSAGNPETLPFFVLYNVDGQQAFFSAGYSAFLGESSSRPEQTNLTFAVEGLEESISAYLFRDLRYSLYIPRDDWQYHRTLEHDLLTRSWTSVINSDVSLTVRHLGYRSLTEAQEWEREQNADFRLMEDEKGGIGGPDREDKSMLEIFLYSGQGVVYAVELRYPVEATEGFGARLHVIRDTFEIVPSII